MAWPNHGHSSFGVGSGDDKGPSLSLLKCSPHDAASPSRIEVLVVTRGNVWEFLRHGLLCKDRFRQDFQSKLRVPDANPAFLLGAQTEAACCVLWSRRRVEKVERGCEVQSSVSLILWRLPSDYAQKLRRSNRSYVLLKLVLLVKRAIGFARSDFQPSPLRFCADVVSSMKLFANTMGTAVRIRFSAMGEGESNTLMGHNA